MVDNDFRLRKSQIAAFMVIGAGLYYLTGSFFMSLGIMLLLILGVHSLASLYIYIDYTRNGVDTSHRA